MPVDTRRLQGPEDAIPYHILQKTAVDSSKKNPLDVVDTAGVRRDQRKANEARKLCKKITVGRRSQSKNPFRMPCITILS